MDSISAPFVLIILNFFPNLQKTVLANKIGSLVHFCMYVCVHTHNFLLYTTTRDGFKLYGKY